VKIIGTYHRDEGAIEAERLNNDANRRIKQLECELSLAEEGLANYEEESQRLEQEIERLRAALLEHACHCGRSDPDPEIHAPWCPYRIACSGVPQEP